MRYATLIRNAWQIARQSPRLVRFAVIPAVFEIIVTLMQAGWQAYRYSETFGIIEEESYLSGLVNLFGWIGSSNLWGSTAVLLVLLVVFNYLIPPLFRGVVLLGVRHRLDRGFGHMSLRQKLIESGRLFFPMMELNAVKSFFSVWGTVLYGLSFYRWTVAGDLPLPWGAIRIFWVFMLCIAVLGTIFLSFSYFFMAYDKEALKPSIWKSVGLSFVRLGKVLSVGLLMLLVNLRVVVNIILVLGIPFALAGLGAWWLSPVTSFLVWFISGLMLLVTAYLNAMLDVFSDAVWAQVYRHLKGLQDEADAAA